MKVAQLTELHQNKIKDGEIITTTPNESALAALSKMKDNSIHHLPVLEGNRLVGIVSDRDLLSRALEIHLGERLSWLSVGEAMRRNPPIVSEDLEVGEVLNEMIKGGYGALPVFRNGKIAGIVTESDILRLTASLLERRHTALAPGSVYLSSPLAQKFLAMLSDLGI